MSSRTNSSLRYWNVWMREKSEETFLVQGARAPRFGEIIIGFLCVLGVLAR